MAELEVAQASAGGAGGVAPDATWRTFAELLEREASAVGAGPAGARLLHEAGRLHEVVLGDRERALTLYRRGVTADEQSLPCLQAARRVAHALGQAALECDLLEAEAAAVHSERDAAALKLARARLLAEALGRPSEGRATLAAAAATDPESLAIVEHQAALAAAEERHDELSRALERCASLCGDRALAAAWLVCAATLEAHPLGRAERAAELALRAFALTPEDPGVRAVARRHAELQRRPGPLAEVLAAEAADPATPPREAALAWCAVARLREEALQDAPGAAEALGRARQAGGEDPLVLEALARIHEARQDWAAAAEVLRACAASTAARGAAAEATEVVEGNLRLGELLAERLGRLEEAAACYRAALAIEPGHRGALSALARILSAAADWEGLLQVCLAEREAAADPRDRAQRCFKAGEVLEERLQREDEAIQLYVEALALDPALLAAHQGLERLYTNMGRHAELAALLEADLGRVRDPDEQVALLLRLARLQEDQLADAEAAAATYARVLEVAPRHAAALRALAGLHERAGRFAQLVEVQERLAALCGEPRQAASLLQRKAEVQEEHLADPAGAAATFERVLALEPLHLPALRALGRLYGRAGRWQDLVAMSRAEAELSPSTEAAANVLYRAGDVLERRLGQEADAIGAYREVLTLSPAHVGALGALARLYRARGEWEPLIEVLTADAAVRAAPERKAALLCEVGEIWEQRLGDAPHAIEVHEEALRLAPAFGPSLRALEQLLADAGRWPEVARLRDEEAARTQGPARAAALLGGARVRLLHLHDPEAAERSCRAALEEVPGHPAALVLLDALPRCRTEARLALAARLPDPRRGAQLLVSAALDRAGAGQRDAAAAALEAAAELSPGDPVAGPLVEAPAAADDPAEVAAHALARAALEPEPAGRASWTARAAEAWERARDDARALATYREALALDPVALPVLAAQARVLARTGAWAEARAALRARAALHRDGALAAAALAEAGEIALDRLDDEAGAAEDWRAALGRQPDHPVRNALLALYRAAGRGAEALELLEARARALPAGREAADAWTAAAGLAFDLGDPARALAGVGRALEADPGLLAALGLRSRLLRQAGRHAEAARDLGTCLTLARTPAELATAHLELAALHEGPLADPARALSHLNAVLAAEPDHTGALNRLAALHREARNWPAAADALRRLIALPDQPADERRRLLLALATVREEGYDDVAGARALCERALEAVPGDVEVLERLARLGERAGDPHGVVAALESAAASATGEERARAHLRAAHVLATALDDPRRAALQVRRALEADPTNGEARVRLADLYGRFDPALAVEEHRKLLAADPGRVDSWRALYDVFRGAKAHDRAFVAAAVLRFLRASDPAKDGFYYEDGARQLPPPGPTPLAPADWDALRHSADAWPLSEVLAIAGHALAEAVAWPLARERTKPPEALSALAAPIAAAAGLEALPIKMGDADEVTVEPWDPPFLRVGVDLARRTPPALLRFLLARAAARIRARSGLAVRLDPQALGEVVAAVVQQVVPGYDRTGVPPDRLSREVGRALSRKMRKALEASARALAAAPPPDLAAWRSGLAATADRFGLLLAGDLPAALQLVMLEQGASHGDDVVAAVRGRPVLGQLLVFLVSEEHLRLRQRLKLGLA